MASLSKVPPHSADAERSVLGAILVDRDGMLQICDLLAPDDFYDPNHSLIYGAMLGLYTRNRPIDILTLREALDDRGELVKVGGDIYLIELTNSVYSSANVFQYAQIVKNKSVLRRLIKAGNEILMLGYDEETELPRLLERAEQALFPVTQTFVQNRLVHIKDIIGLRYEEFAEIHANPDIIRDSIINTGFPTLDHKLGGLKRGDMVVLAARPSMGKTALMLNIAQNVADR